MRRAELAFPGAGDVMRPSRSTRLAMLQMTITVSAIVALEIAIFLAGPHKPSWRLDLFSIVGLEYVAGGLLAWLRRPGNGTGTLLSLSGLSLLAGATEDSHVTFLRALGLLVNDLPLGVMLHLLLAFPAGRIHDRLTRRLVIAGYAISLFPTIVAVLWSPDESVPDAVRVGSSQHVVSIAHWTENVAATIVVGLAVGLLTLRWRRAEPSARRALAIVYSFAGFAFASLVISTVVLDPLLNLTPRELFLMQIIPVAGIPIGFVIGLSWGGFAPTRELDELVAWLGTATKDRLTLRQALRTTIGDPSVELHFWVHDGARYVSADGSLAPLPEPSSGRAAIDVSTPTAGRIAVISYDATLVDLELVRNAGRVLAMQLEGERLTEDLIASREALLESRSRLVESADRERRRIARDLHDGLQGRLVVLALRAGQVAQSIGDSNPHTADVVALRDDLEGAIADLRRLVHGVLPELLIQRGLPAAVEELLDQTPLRSRLDVTNGEQRLPPQVETAGYFVVAEGLANATKHARASQVRVELVHGPNRLTIEVCDDGIGGADVDAGTGLRGLADRIEALGGRLEVDSTAGNGTVLVAEVPCEL